MRVRNVAFPAIGTGACYDYPLAEAARGALGTLLELLAAEPGLGEVRFVLLDDEAERAYVPALKAPLERQLPVESRG